MDSTDHENIPSSNLDKIYLNIVHTGFDYVNPAVSSNKTSKSEADTTTAKISFNKSMPVINTSGHFDISKDVQTKLTTSSYGEKYQPFGWLYKNLDFSGFLKTSNPEVNENFVVNEEAGGKPKNRISKATGPRKYVLSNFDLNALSPNSW